MNFHRDRPREEPELNLIPMIDVMLVILIFLMITTTYSKYTELQINLPTADAEKQPERPGEINVLVNSAGQYVINKSAVAVSTLQAPADDLRRAGATHKDPVIVISPTQTPPGRDPRDGGRAPRRLSADPFTTVASKQAAPAVIARRPRSELVPQGALAYALRQRAGCSALSSRCAGWPTACGSRTGIMRGSRSSWSGISPSAAAARPLVLWIAGILKRNGFARGS